jgi:hypothetical protein
MIKAALVALLGILALLLVKATFDTLVDRPPARPSEAVTTSIAKKSSPRPPLRPNPVIAPGLPDLNAGYLFNSQRFLAKENRADAADKGPDHTIRPEDVVFNGALLGQGYRTALVSYTLAPKQEIRPGRPGPASQTSRRQGSIQLGIGDELGGYTVTEITADFILFSKAGETIKKTLFDSDKQRHQATSRRPPAGAPPSPQPPALIAPQRRPLPTPPQNP